MTYASTNKSNMVDFYKQKCVRGGGGRLIQAIIASFIQYFNFEQYIIYEHYI